MAEDCEKPKAFTDGSPRPGGGGCTGGDEEHTTDNQRAIWPAGAEQEWAGVAHTGMGRCDTHRCRAAV